MLSAADARRLATIPKRAQNEIEASYDGWCHERRWRTEHGFRFKIMGSIEASSDVNPMQQPDERRRMRNILLDVLAVMVDDDGDTEEAETAMRT